MVVGLGRIARSWVPRAAFLLVLACGAQLARAGQPAADGLVGAIAIPSQEAAEVVPVVRREYRVAGISKPIAVDGKLDDWKAAGVAGVALAGPQHASWFHGQYGGATDLSLTFYLARDERALYLAVDVTDDAPGQDDRLEFSFDTLNNDAVIHEWRDVGRRYDNDDHHVVVVPTDGGGRAAWRHRPRELARDVLERVEVRVARRAGGLVYEVALPWLALTPYVPTSYEPMKFNLAVLDHDGEDRAGALAWTPGLVMTYSGGHFGTLRFEPPKAPPHPIESFLVVPAPRFTDQDIPIRAHFHNHAQALAGCTLEIRAKGQAGDTVASASAKIELPHGASRSELKMHSEKLGHGEFAFEGLLTTPDGKKLTLPVHTTQASGKVFVQSVATVKAGIERLKAQAAELARLYAEVEKNGELDPAYPRAYKTLFEMFIPRCEDDLKHHDSARVLRNCEYLHALFPRCKAYTERVLQDPSTQLTVPHRIVPDRLRIRKGTYWHDGRPVFLWGPGTFWYVRNQLDWVAGLGFNCQQTGEQPMHGLGNEKTRAEAKAYLDKCYRLGIANNANISFDRGRQLIKEHPETANRDPNNFTPFIIQHPLTRQWLKDWYSEVVPWLSGHPSIISYVVVNEPWYTNYGELTRKAFIEDYLKPTYGSIAALNQRWHTSYADFDAIKLPTWIDLDNHAPWYEFLRFRDRLLLDYFTWMKSCVHQLDPTRPAQYKFMAMSLQSFDMEAIQETADVVGFDGNMTNRDIPYLDFSNSLWPDRPLVNTEVHIAYGGEKMVENVAWRLALHGLACGNWWCWHTNPRFCDSLGNAQSMHALAKSGLDLQRLFHPYVYELNRKPRSIATLFPDIIERRTDKSIVRIRFEVMAAQYPLGIHPFYATERRIAAGELRRHKLLFAPESDYVADTTYRKVVAYVARGGRVILAPGGFAHNAYGDPRDTAAFIRPNTGNPLCEGATVYRHGRGEVVCMNALGYEADIKTDGSEVCAPTATVRNVQRRKLYYRVLRAAMERYGLQDPVRLAPKGGDEDAIPWNLDWRYARVDGAHILAVVYHGWGKPRPLECTLDSRLDIQGVTDLVTGEKLPAEPFVVDHGPHLYRLEVGKTGWLFWRRDATRKKPPPSQDPADEQREKLQRMHNDLIFQP